MVKRPVRAEKNIRAVPMKGVITGPVIFAGSEKKLFTMMMAGSFISGFLAVSWWRMRSVQAIWTGSNGAQDTVQAGRIISTDTSGNIMCV